MSTYLPSAAPPLKSSKIKWLAALSPWLRRGRLALACLRLLLVSTGLLLCGLTGPGVVAAQTTCTEASAAVASYGDGDTSTDDIPGLVADCTTLLGLKAALIGTATLGTTTKTDWSVATAIGTWDGVTVGQVGTPEEQTWRVTKLVLGSKDLTGTIPEALGNLSALTDLYLNDNQLTGAIPPALGTLSALTHLNLGLNQLEGTIPPTWGSATHPLPALEALNLSSNLNKDEDENIISGLSGSIPPALGNLRALTHLALNNNQLTGRIPTALGNLRALKQLYLHGNQLGGGIPPVLGNLRALERLVLGENQLTGRIPTALGNLSALKTLDLSINKLTGPIPAALGALGTDNADPANPVYNLTELILSENQLTGRIPATWGSTTYPLSALTRLSLSNNKLTGGIPATWGSTTHPLGALKTLNLSNNKLANTIPAALGGLTNLTLLWLHNNALSGAIPAALGDLTNLTQLNLSNNALSEAIPAELGSLTKLTDLNLSNNALTGEIPAGVENNTPTGLAKLTTLRFLFLNNNRLGLDPTDNTSKWGIPAALGGLTNLWYLHLHNNQLTGTIPAALGSLTNLWYLHLHNNQLTGTIPAALGSLTNLLGLALLNNALTGTIPVQLGSLAKLSYLQLNHNQLTGTIPTEWGRTTGSPPYPLTALRYLDLSLNKLSSCTLPTLLQAKVDATPPTLTFRCIIAVTLPDSHDAKDYTVRTVRSDSTDQNERAALRKSAPLYTTFGGPMFTISVLDEDGDPITDPLDTPLRVCLPIPPGIHPTQAYLYRYNADTNTWERLTEGRTQDATQVCALVSQFSFFRVGSYAPPPPKANVRSTSALIPKNAEGEKLFTVGGSFRLLFITSEQTRANSDDIATYNAFVQAQAATAPGLRGFSSKFRALISTSAVDARDNTATLGKGVPIYWVGGAKVADDYDDFYDETWDERTGRTESGEGFDNRRQVWTGSNDDGTRHATNFAGSNSVRVSSISGITGSQFQGPPFSALNQPASQEHNILRLYALSPVFTVIRSGGGGGGVTTTGGGGGGGGGGGASDRHGNTPETASPVRLGAGAPWASSTTGQISRRDVDYFSLTLPHAGVLVAQTSGSVDTVGTVWQAGEEIAQAASGGTGRNFRLAVRVKAGAVVIAVRGQGGATGAYRLETSLVAGYLGNPGPNSFQSGVGVLSGWVCGVEGVDIEIETAGGAVQRYEAAYGTERPDTAAICGDTDSGFGVLFNWNRLGDGAHSVVAVVDGVPLGRRRTVDGIELGRATVTVTTLGTEWMEDVAGSCEVEDFPSPGETVRLAWQQGRQNFGITGEQVPAGENRAGSPGVGYLGNPGPNSFQSGVGVISGWVCDAERVEVEVGHLGRQPAGYGTERLDTREACGDTDNGFGLLFNWNRLGDGEHTVVAYVDDVELGRATVQVVTLGTEWVADAVGACVVADFPTVGETTTLAWQQSQQNFVITGVE